MNISQTFNVPGVGQNKLPKWAKPACQTQLVYVMSFWWKMKGHAWLNGTALYYVTQLQEIQRIPLPRNQ